MKSVIAKTIIMILMMIFIISVSLVEASDVFVVTAIAAFLALAGFCSLNKKELLSNNA